MNKLNIVLTPLRDAVLAGARSHLEVLVRLQAPERPAAATRARGPLHLALVIDRSGSMSGQPLAEAKRCARRVIDGLQPGDRAALVVYDDQVQTLCPLVGTDERDRLRQAIDAITEGGMTNLHGGWLAGAKALAPHSGGQALSRVILLSDGQANEGLTDIDGIASHCAQLAEAGVTTSTYGLGRHFNEALMTRMADAGRGNAYYGQTADDLADPFQEELELLAALCAKELRLEAEAGPGVTIELLNDGYATAPAGGWRLPDVAYGGEAWALLRLTVEPHDATALAELNLLSVRAHWSDLDGRTSHAETPALVLPALPPAAFAAVEEDSLVRRRLAEVTVARLQQRAREAARRHDWNAVDAALAQAREASRENPWLENVVDELKELAARRDEEMLSKEAMYSSRRAMSRLASVNESALPDAMADSEPAFLRRKRVQGRGERRP
ncbi:MAG: VWA domain-containing protein [Gammaproteobacteria bacterium]|nr:VWA domain-containing protein [Gammaproteobacteria bacterium]